MNAVYWLGFFIVLLVIEIITLGLTTIWFAAGALVAFIASVAGLNAGVQWILFFVISIGLLLVTRPLAVRYFNKDRTKTNAESLIGKTATVIEAVDNLREQGKALVQGMEWTARAVSDDEIIEEDSIVTIVSISGVKLIVQRTEEA